MANLLDRASVVLTPTAYNNGEALCIKPDDGSGDFQFSRNSAATRVNAQGLVENVQILSSNLVQNPSFSEEGVQEVSNGSFSQEGSELITNGNFDTDSDWTKQASWSISGGKAISDGTQTGNSGLIQTNVFEVGKTYRLDFDLTSNYEEFKFFVNGSQNIFSTNLSDGSHQYYFTTTTSGSAYFQATVNFIGSIDNVSVREVGQDWTLGTGWSIGEDKAIANTTGNFVNLYQNSVFVVGKTYKTTFTISDYTQGSVRLTENGYDISGFQNAVGTYTTYFTASQTALYMQGYESFIGSITNISVKEVGQNWVLNDWSVGDSLISSGNTSTLLQQSFIYTSTTSIYKTTFRARSVSGASVSLRLYDGGGTNYETFTITSSNFQDFELTRQRAGADSGLSFYNNSNAEIEITNISVIEITTDTSLPRINYEGFSYQDALGSEEIVNGSFDSDTAWTKGAGWSIANGFASHNASLGAGDLYQDLNLTVSKSYKITIEITATDATELYFMTDSGNYVEVSGSPIGKHSYVFVATNSLQSVGVRGSGNWDGSIDNVSVKEYLGQEVVPDSGCGSWLFEPQSTNLVTQSEDLSDASWSKFNSTASSSTIVNPEGTNGASLFVCNNFSGTNQYFRINPNTTYNNDVDYSYSMFVKYNTFQFCKLTYVNYSVPEHFTAVFDIINGTVTDTDTSGTPQNTSSKIEDFGNNWFRISISAAISSSSGNSMNFEFNKTPSGTPTFDIFGRTDQTTTTNDKVYIYGAQIEQQTYATSYIPTSGATVTRNQDVCTNGGSLASINSTEGVLYAEIAALTDGGTFRGISLNDGTTNNNNVIRIYCASADNRITIIIRANGSLIFNYSHTLTSITDFNKIAIKYKQNDFSLWVNGVNIHTETTGNTPIGLNELLFNNGLGTETFYGKTKALAVWKEALTGSELQSLTTI